jgi:hypothetical protein
MNRLKQPSTWKGLAMLISQAGWMAPGEAQAAGAIAAVAVPLIIGIWETVRDEKKVEK